MARVTHHPKNGSKCAFCKSWSGDANPVFKNTQTGFEYSSGVPGRCLKLNGNFSSSHGNNCKSYQPSVEADRVL